MFHNFRRVSPGELQDLVNNVCQVQHFLAAPAKPGMQLSFPCSAVWILGGIEVLYFENGEMPVFPIVFKGKHLSGDASGLSDDESQNPTRYFSPQL